MAIQATLLVCDDVRVEWNSKAILIGLYTTDMTIPFEPFIVPQLQFFLIFECGVAERPNKLTLEITLPKQSPIKWEIPLPEMGPVPEGRTRFFLRQPFAVGNPQLMAGHIVGRVTFDGGEIAVGGPWIMLMQSQQTGAPAV